MSEALAQYLAQRPEGSGLLSPVDLQGTLRTLFEGGVDILPLPYKIFFVDESIPPVLGFPVRDSSVLRELDAKLEHWMGLEVHWQLTRDSSKKAADTALASYLSHLVRVTENAVLSNLLADYHGIFWLAHSQQLSRHFSSLKKKIIALDTEAGRNRGDQLRFRVFLRWSVDVREQMTQLAMRTGQVLEGEEERALQFFRLLQENVIILTEEFISPDLRELRSFLTGYLNQNYFHFRDTFEKIRGTSNSLLKSDRVFRGALEMFAGAKVSEITTGLLLDGRFQSFIFEHPSLERELRSEERELIRSISRRLGQFAVLQELRRGIHWMTAGSGDEIVSTDRHQIRYAKTTRPIDFGHSGVVDPMVYRFGLMYDITSFSETLGNIARGGVKGELGSYRQMLLFQRRLDAIATRHNLQLEKFLGDGAFYTTRTVIPLVRAAAEIQRFYDELRKKGFAFDRGLRIALNYGYYRLLPMRGRPTSGDRSMEFYGPGVVELSRLTTGKAMKEIEEIESYLIAHGFELSAVQKFFAPLTSGQNANGRAERQRDFHAEVDGNGHLVNEGIVASLPFLQELSSELIADSHQLVRLKVPWATYIGFRPDIEKVAWVGIRLIGTVSLKGLDKVEVAEMIRVAEDEATVTPIGQSGELISLLRQNFHGENAADAEAVPSETSEHGASRRDSSKLLELVLCSKDERAANDDGILIGEWDPHSDEISSSIRIPKRDLEALFGADGSLTRETLEQHRGVLQRIYRKMRLTSDVPPVRLDSLRRQREYLAFILGERVKGEGE